MNAAGAQSEYESSVTGGARKERSDARIIVWGSPTIDWLNVQHGPESGEKGKQHRVHLGAQPGGVALLARLVESMSPKIDKKTVEKTILSARWVKDLNCDAALRSGLSSGPTNQAGRKASAAAPDQHNTSTTRLDKIVPTDDAYRHTWSTWVYVASDPIGAEVRKVRGLAADGAYRMLSPGILNSELERVELDTNGAQNLDHYSIDWNSSDESARRKLYIIDDPGDVEYYDGKLRFRGAAPKKPDDSPAADNGVAHKRRDAFHKFIEDERILGRLRNEAAESCENDLQILLRLDLRSADLTSSVASTPLCEYFRSHRALAQRTTVVVRVRDLRASEQRVGASLSWERLFDDIRQSALRCFWHSESRFFGADGFKRAIVVVGHSGALLLDSANLETPYSMVFDRIGQEDDFAGPIEGMVLGSTTCLLAALATAWLDNEWAASGSRVEGQGANETAKAADANAGTAENRYRFEKSGLDNPLLRAIQKGCAMMRCLLSYGYERTVRPRGRQVLEFPFAQVRDCYYGVPGPIPGQYRPSKKSETNWEKQLGTIRRAEPFGPRGTVLADKLGNEEEVIKMAKRIVREGESALDDVPVGRFKKWYSADRTEIEGVRSVHNAIRDYLRKDAGVTGRSVRQPLSIAVFGPPGSGKSFIVEQIALEIGLDVSARLTFNLSQFESAAELARAFHQVRDVLLRSNHPPLVFWDEFDSMLGSQRFGWLRHFLAPMQDALFVDQGRVHSIGRGIYIFAGGTRHSFDEFAREPSDPVESERERAAKKPDFVSRIRAYIDVKGPNQADNKTEELDAVQDDRFYVIRRAFLLRGSLSKHAEHIRKSGTKFVVDEGVLDAFLRAKGYKHGSRSLDSVVALSSFEGKSKYELSSLPPEHLLGMHIQDVSAFVGHLFQSESSNAS